MIEHFVKQGFPRTRVQEASNKARNKDRMTLLEIKSAPTQNDDSVILVTTYKPEFNGLKDAVQKN